MKILDSIKLIFMILCVLCFQRQSFLTFIYKSMTDSYMGHAERKSDIEQAQSVQFTSSRTSSMSPPGICFPLKNNVSNIFNADSKGPDQTVLIYIILDMLNVSFGHLLFIKKITYPMILSCPHMPEVFAWYGPYVQ